MENVLEPGLGLTTVFPRIAEPSQQPEKSKYVTYTAEQWDLVRPLISILYLKEGNTLKHVMEQMKLYNFYATYVCSQLADSFDSH